MNRWILSLLVVVALLGLVFLNQSPSETSAPAPAAVASSTPDRWVGLSLSDFLSQADMELVELSPETITFYGLADMLGVRNDRLDPLTVEFENQYYDLVQEISDHLASFDLSKESVDVQLWASIYAESLDDTLASRPFSDNAYLVSSYMDSYPSYIEWFLTTFHPFDTQQDAEDYIARLYEIAVRFSEVEDRLVDSQRINAIPPRFMLEDAVDQLRSTGNTPTQETSFYAAIDAGLAGISGLSNSKSTQLLAQAEEAITTSVLPAYLDLADYVEAMAANASDDAGVWKAANGDAYYAYLLRSYTTTSMTADEIYQFGLDEVARVESEVRAAAADLGMDSQLSIPEIFGQLTEETGTSLGQETIDRCQELIDGIEPIVAPAFSYFPVSEIQVVDGGSDTYFSPGTPDGSRPGMFFAPTETPQPIYELPTVTYHEAIPGHGFQAAYAYSVDLPTYLLGLSFTAYAEGWALYAERLSWEMGAYSDNPYGNMGRLQDELFRAVRLVVDPGIHAKHWTYEQAVDYMIENTGFDEDYVHSEVQRYIASPAQAVTYKIGMQKFLELRERAESALGDAFSLPEFHDAVLSHGELPLSILEQVVDEYIASHVQG
jgi:uncharacterized protein (DUF885 family)